MYKLDEIDGIVFDMDGVIFDTEQLGLRCWKIVGDRHGLENMEETVRKCIGTSSKDTKRIMNEAYGKLVDFEELYAESRTVIRETFEKEGIPLKNGAPQVVRWLHDKGVKVGLASSTNYETVIREMKEVGLIDCFEVIIGGDMVENSKPEPDIYRIACETLGVRPENTLAVEDSLNGIRAAYGAGMIPVLIPDLIEPTDEMLEKAYVKLDNISQLKAGLSEDGI